MIFLNLKAQIFENIIQTNFTDFQLLNRHSLFQFLIDLNEFLLMYLQTGKLQYILKFNLCQKRPSRTLEITIVLQKETRKIFEIIISENYYANMQTTDSISSVTYHLFQKQFGEFFLIYLNFSGGC